LGVAHLLEGSVRRQGDQVRITAQLVRASDGMHEWSQKYDRSLDDIFSIQDDIAANVLQALEIVLDDAQRQRMQNVGVRDVGVRRISERGFLTRDEQEQTLIELRRSLDAAYESSNDPLLRAIINVDRTLFSNDWSELRKRIELALSESGCARTILLEQAMLMGYAERLVDLYRRETTCAPLIHAGLVGRCRLVDVGGRPRPHSAPPR
jgi:adenylate cyclase